MKDMNFDNSNCQQTQKKKYEMPEIIVHGTAEEITKVLKIHRLDQVGHIGISAALRN